MRLWRLLCGTLVACLLVACCTVQADVVVRPEDRVPNRSPGYCAWCSLQTLANVLRREHPDDVGLARAATLVEARSKEKGPLVLRRYPDGTTVQEVGDPGGATETIVREQLTRMKIPFRERPGDRKHDVAFLRDCCARGVGAMATLDNWHGPGTSHAIAVISVSAEKVKVSGVEDYAVTFIDSNDVKQPYRASLSWFCNYWTGWAVALEPQSTTPKPSTPKPLKPALPGKTVAPTLPDDEE